MLGSLANTETEALTTAKARIAELEAENARMREAASTTKQQQRIDEARFGMALLATMDLRQVERATKKYIEYRDEGWIPEGLGVSAGYLGASNGN